MQISWIWAILNFRTINNEISKLCLHKWLNKWLSDFAGQKEDDKLLTKCWFSKQEQKTSPCPDDQHQWSCPKVLPLNQLVLWFDSRIDVDQSRKEERLRLPLIPFSNSAYFLGDIHRDSSVLWNKWSGLLCWRDGLKWLIVLIYPSNAGLSGIQDAEVDGLFILWAHSVQKKSCRRQIWASKLLV